VVRRPIENIRQAQINMKGWQQDRQWASKDRMKNVHRTSMGRKTMMKVIDGSGFDKEK
jgi:hypothetical protein